MRYNLKKKKTENSVWLWVLVNFTEKAYTLHTLQTTWFRRATSQSYSLLPIMALQDNRCQPLPWSSPCKFRGIYLSFSPTPGSQLKNYLSKKIDYRLIVDIIYSTGRPEIVPLYVPASNIHIYWDILHYRWLELPWQQPTWGNCGSLGTFFLKNLIPVCDLFPHQAPALSRFFSKPRREYPGWRLDNSFMQKK